MLDRDQQTGYFRLWQRHDLPAVAAGLGAAQPTSKGPKGRWPEALRGVPAVIGGRRRSIGGWRQERDFFPLRDRGRLLFGGDGFRD